MMILLGVGMVKGIDKGRPLRAALLSSVALLVGFGAFPQLAYAQCSPNPSQSGQAVACSGTTTGGYVITTDQSPLTVASGASLQNIGGDALTVSIPAVSGTYASRTASITVAGSISASGGNGISVWSGPSDGVDVDYYGTSATVTVAAGGSVTGVYGINLAQTPGALSANAQVSVSLDNFGTITGTSGIALASGSGGYYTPSPSYSLTNEVGGTIGAIAANVQTLTNNGTINGGALSAIAPATVTYSANISNSGTIQSNSASATINMANASVTNSGTITNTSSGAAMANVFGVTNQVGGTISASGADVIMGAANSLLQVANSGNITNTGSGQAVSGYNVYVTNNAGGVISAGGGGTAINASTGLTLVNTGTINGNVLAGLSAGYGWNSVDSSMGTINGNVTFGAGANTLVATLNNGALQTGITGTITGGIGANTTNTLQLNTTANATLASAVVAPSNFTVEFAPAAGTTLTLASGFSSPGTINFAGSGTLAVTGSISGSGQIISGTYNWGTLTNSGSISSNNAGGPAAISFVIGYSSIVNTGSINATGDAISLNGIAVSNSGTITAGGTGVSAFVQSGLTNTGTITSTGGTAVALSQTCDCSTSTNSGTINGGQVGLNLQDGILVNTGTITSAGYGIALQAYGTVENQAGGIITGGTMAIGAITFAPGISSVSNAGTINGNVNLANAGFGTNSYTALAGGVLNGNLTLGVGDTLITDLANSGGGAFGGVNGTVTANQSNLIYTVEASATTTPTAPAGFSSVAYALSNNPTLTLAGGGTYTATLGLAGTGSVIINGNVATTDAVAVQTQANVGGVLNNPGQTPAIALINNGTISASAVTPYSGAQAAVRMLGGSDTLVNNGTISLTNTSSTGNGYYAAVEYGQSVTNGGTISGIGAAAVSLQGTLTNTGTITSDQTAVIAQNGGTITNSGTITSTGGAAIGAVIQPYGYADATPQINNLAGGVIAGNGDAIDVQGGSISNAGQINGNVNLAFSNNGYAMNAAGSYIDAGGTLNGNLTLGANDALVVNLSSVGTGPLGGVTGTINANGAALVYNLSANTTTTGVDAVAGFGSQVYQLTNDPTLTLAAGSSPIASTVALAGTGTVIINAAISTTNQSAVASQPAISFNGMPSAANALAITNNAVLTETVSNPSILAWTVLLGNADTLTNNGTINLVNATGGPLAYSTYSAAVAGGQSITNTGMISATGAAAVLLNDNATATPQALTNSGTITSDQAGVAVVSDGVDTITNSGTISGGQYGISLNGSAAISNSGSITGTTSGILLSSFGGGSISNSGTISSAAGPAIAGGPYSVYYGTITNQAGGVISGVGTGGNGDAIDLSGGTVINAGTITGNVNLASGIYSGQAGNYVSNGGTLTGNLTFGSGNNTLIVIGNNSGISGTINGGGGYDTYAQGFTASASIDLTTLAVPAGFSALGVGAIGAGTTVTVTGPAGGITQAPIYFGDGAIINTVDIHGAGPAVALGWANAALGLGGLSFVNSAAIDPGVSGSVASFSNSGTVGTTSLGYGAVQLTAAGPNFAFTNSGVIASAYSPFFLTQSVFIGANTNLTSATISNSGSIDYGLSAYLPAATISVTNSGVMGSPGASAEGLMIYAEPLSVAQGANPSATSLTLSNTATGTVQGGVFVGGTVQNMTVTNAGAVEGWLSAVQDQASVYNPATQTTAFLDQISASVTNSGTVSGSLYMVAAAGTASLTNSGSVVQTGTQNFTAQAAALLSNVTTGNSTLSATNSGLLSNSGSGGGGLVVYDAAGNSADPTSAATTTISVTNSGAINASGGSMYNPGGSPQLALSAGLAVLASATGGASATVTNAAGGTITASGATAPSLGYDPSVVPAALATSGPVGLFVQANTITINNAGTITGGPDIAVPAGTVVSISYNPISLLTPVIAGGIEAYGATIAFNNAASGVVNGNVKLAATTSATVVNKGTLAGNVSFGTGNVSFTQGLGGTLGGTVTGGGGINTLLIDITGGGVLSQSLLNSFVNFAAPQIIGSGTISTTGPLALSSLVLGGANLTLAAGSTLQTAGPIAITAGSGTSTFTNYGTVNGGIVKVATTNGAGGTINFTAPFATNAAITNLAGGTLNAAGMITVPTLLDSGTLNVTGALSLTGTLQVNSGGAVNLGGNAATITQVLLAGGTLQNGTLNSAVTSNGGTINGLSGAASLSTAAGTTTLAGGNSYTGATNVLGGTLTASTANGFSAGSVTTVSSGGTLDLGGAAQTIAAVNLAGGTLQNGSLTGAVTSSGGVLSGLSGTAGITATAGTTTLSGINSYSGGTLVTGGALAVTGAQALGSGGLILKPATQLILVGGGFTIANPISLVLAGDPTITVASGNTDTLSGVISGPGALTLNGGGTLVLNGNNTYTGATTVTASNLVVNGSIASSASLTLAGGGTVSGSGVLGGVNVAAGAKLSPGASNAMGQLNIGGNLTFASGSIYAVSVNPSSSTSVTVSGTATLSGATVLANVAAGRYIVNKYTILTANGGLGGTTFAGVVAANQPAGVQDSLSYDADHVYLTLAGLLNGGATTGLPGNQQAVTNAINAYFNGGGAVPTSYLGLSALSGAPLSQAMASLSGELPTGTAAVAEQVAGGFLGDMMDPFADGRQAACAKPASLQPGCGFSPKFTVWATAVGGNGRLDGDPDGAGMHQLTSDIFGAASGFDMRVGPGATLGVAVAGGRAQWSLAQGLGNAHSDYFELGANGEVHAARAYLSGALAYGWHAISTTRTVFASDTLAASFHAHDLGGRIEAGLHLGALSPYGALQTQRVTMPGFAESDAGAGSYGLAFAGRSFTDTSAEAGLRLDATVPAGDGNSLGIRLRAAYVRDWTDNPVLGASFVSLPGASFNVAGAAPARNSAATSSALEYHVGSLGTFFAKFDGAFASNAQTYKGSFGLRFDW